MKHSTDELSALVEASLPAVTLIHGEEPQLNLEALDAWRARAKVLGFIERLVLFADDVSFEALAQELGAVSLFAQKRVVEYHTYGDKIPKAAADWLTQYAKTQKQSDTLLIIYAPALEKPEHSNYYKALGEHQLIIFSKKLYPKTFQAQIQQRLKQANVMLHVDAMRQLIRSYEGNLVAAQQIINRLQLLHSPNERLSVSDIAPLLADQAQFNLYTLTDALLVGDYGRAMEISEYFQNDNSNDAQFKIPIMLNAQWHKDCTLLLAMNADTSPDKHQALFQAYKIPTFKQRLYYDAFKKQSIKRLRAILKLTAKLDLGLKGGAVGNYWHQLRQYFIHCLTHQ